MWWWCFEVNPQKGMVAVPQSGLIHLAAKGVEKTTNDLSLSLSLGVVLLPLIVLIV